MLLPTSGDVPVHYASFVVALSLLLGRPGLREASSRWTRGAQVGDPEREPGMSASAGYTRIRDPAVQASGTRIYSRPGSRNDWVRDPGIRPSVTRVYPGPGHGNTRLVAKHLIDGFKHRPPTRQASMGRFTSCLPSEGASRSLGRPQ